MRDFSVRSSVKMSEVKNGLSRFTIQACSAPVRLAAKQFVRFLFSRSEVWKGLVFVNSLPESSFVSWERIFLQILGKGSFADWNVFCARLSVFRAEQANQRLSTSALTGSCKCELGTIWNLLADC